MASAKFIEKATKPIYRRGKVVEYVSKRGKRAGQTLHKRDRNQPEDENDKILINVGESYYTWCFYGGSPIYSKVRPRPSQLTRNWFKSELYSISETVEDCDCKTPEDLATFVEDVISELENLRDECQERYDNIPIQLQECESGEILQSRIEGLEEVISEFENLDLEFESAEDDEKVTWVDEKISEMNSIDINFE